MLTDRMWSLRELFWNVGGSSNSSNFYNFSLYNCCHDHSYVGDTTQIYIFPAFFHWFPSQHTIKKIPMLQHKQSFNCTLYMRQGPQHKYQGRDVFMFKYVIGHFVWCEQKIYIFKTTRKWTELNLLFV